MDDQWTVGHGQRGLERGFQAETVHKHSRGGTEVGRGALLILHRGLDAPEGKEKKMLLKALERG